MSRRLKTSILALTLIISPGFLFLTARPSLTALLTLEKYRHEEEIPILKPAEKKNPLPDGRYFTWKFDREPKIGTVILILSVHNPDGQLTQVYSITGRSDMPSMRGHHDSGEVSFKTNARGLYLLPVDIVMPGEWEVIITFKEKEQTIFRGRILFKV